jgi:hypothetical protein
VGHYTELVFKAKLKKDTPENILQLLNRVIVEKDFGIGDKVLFHSEDVFKPQLSHSFFKCDRWYMLFVSTNWDETLQGGLFYKKGEYWNIDLHTEFKNYDNEISHFIDWITPFVVGRQKKQYLGFWKSEDCSYQINIYIHRS